MSTEQIILALILGTAGIYLGFRLWRGLRGKSACNCGCCADKQKLKK